MDIKNLENKKILVAGAGLSGLAVCRFLLKKKAIITLADAKTKEDLPEALALAKEGVFLLLGGALPDKLSWDLIIKSPGVPGETLLLKMAKEAKIPIIGEVELAFAYAEAPFIAITGTNGKTTTTALIGHIFKNAKREALIGGNIGKPLADAVEGYKGIIIAEVSSFQLEDCVSFAPRAGVFLNFTPDHLDRHITLENYFEAKAKIFACQNKEDYAVLNYDDPSVAGLKERIKSKIIWFSRREILKQGIFCRDNQIVIALDGKIISLMPVEDLPLKGGHNLENALAAVGAAYAFGLEADLIAQGLKSFKGVAHRLEFVIQKNGVKYINDSKATNADSAIKALEAFSGPIILIAGGRNKGGDFTRLMEEIKKRVKLLIILGEAKEEIKNAADKAGFKKYILADSFIEAVREGEKAAAPGDILLLAPACASWDMFKNYEERGNLFKALVTEGR